jgi:hypothetical protein
MSRSKMVQGKAAASPPPSGPAPSENLARRDAKQLASELSHYYAEYAPLFARSEQREWAQLYLRGQLSDLERKSIEPMVLRERGKDPNAVRAVQQFIGEGAWDDDCILERHQQLVAEDLTLRRRLPKLIWFAKRACAGRSRPRWKKAKANWGWIITKPVRGAVGIIT